MNLQRRDLLKAAAGAAALAATGPMLLNARAASMIPSSLGTVQAAPDGDEVIFHGACAPNCWSCCKLLVHVREGRMVKTQMGPLPDSRYNRICLRGLTHVQRVYHPDRLKYPLKRVGERGEGKWQRISWDEAINTIAGKFSEVKQKYGSKAIAVLPASGYYGFLNGFYGSIHRFANIFECTLGEGAIDSAVPLGIHQVLGGPYTYQGNEAADLADARLTIVWGANITESNIHNWHFVADSVENGGKLIVIDPNFTVVASKSDKWVRVKPGSDTAFGLAMINTIIEESLFDEEFVVEHTVGPFLVREDTQLFLREKDTKEDGSDKYMIWDSATGQALPYDADGTSPALSGSYRPSEIPCRTAFQMLRDHLSQYSPENASKITDVDPDTIRMVAREYATRKPATIYWGFGLDRYYHGDLVGRTIATLAALTGNIGKAGATPCGGFGGATMVSSKVNLGAWHYPTKGRHTFINNLIMYDALEKGDELGYPVKAIYISNSNYVVTFPNQNKILKQLFPKMELIVVADFSMTDTARHADIVLPITTWFENDDLVPSMHVHVMLQEKAIDPMYECKSDLEIFSLLAEKLGFGEHFDKTAEDYIRLLLDSPELRSRGITHELLKKEGAFRVPPLPHIPFTDGKYDTPSGRIEFYNETVMSRSPGSPESKELEFKLPVFLPPIEAWPDNPLAAKYPLVCCQPGSRFRVHTQYFNIPWLREVDPRPLVEMNPLDAEARGIRDEDPVEVFNDRGSVKLWARLNGGIRPGLVNIARGAASEEFLGGASQGLIADYRNPVTLNCSFFDTLVEVRKI